MRRTTNKKKGVTTKERRRRLDLEPPPHPYPVLREWRLKHLARFVKFAYSRATTDDLLREMWSMRREIFARSASAQFPADPSQAHRRIKKLQAALRRGLRTMADGQRDAGSSWDLPPLACYVTLRNDRFFSLYEGGLDTLLLYECRDLLIGLPGWRLQKCSAEGCQDVFVKTKKARYCTTHGSEQARSERYRDSLKTRLTPEQIRDRRHSYYLARVERQNGKTAVAKVRKRGLSGTERTSLLARDAVEAVGRASPPKG